MRALSQSAPFAVSLGSRPFRIISGQPWVLQLLITSLASQPSVNKHVSLSVEEGGAFDCHIHALLSIDKAASSPEFGSRLGTSAVRGDIPTVWSDISSADSSFGPLCHPAPCSLQGETAEPYGS